MDPIYLLAIVRKRRDKTSKLTRIAKCDFCNDAIFEGQKTGEWWSIWVYDSPIKAVSTLFFIGRDMDPGVRGAELLSEMLTTSLSRFSGQKWDVEGVGPIDSEDAALVRIELEVV